MRFTVTEIRHYYHNLELPEVLWRWSRKHYRLETLGGHWIKLNRREDRISAEELRSYLVRYTPRHVYMSVMDSLRPQLVGKRRKSHVALPIGGVFVVDVDSYQKARGHDHHLDPSWGVCEGCLEKSKYMTLDLCDRIHEDYNEVEIVFSGRRGFHVWVLDFDYKRYVKPNPRDPVKAQAAARFKYARSLYGHPWDRSHFILSCDPLRVMAVPNTLNMDTGLVCLHIGRPWVLENLSMRRLVEKASPLARIYSEPFAASMLWLP